MLKVLKRGKRKMQYQWFVFWSGLFDWLIFSVSLFVIADKLGWQKKRPGSPGAASAPVILSDEGLSAHLRERTVKDFGKKRCLLKDISLNIPPNSLVLLLGGSGAGKTTLINALIGYEQADATVLLNGVNVYKEYDRVKHKIGFVPLQNLIRGKDTVIRTVSDAAEMRLPTSISTEQRKQLIKEDMDLLGLSAGLPEPCPHVQCPRPHVVGDQVVELVRAVLFLCSSSDVKSPLQ